MATTSPHNARPLIKPLLCLLLLCFIVRGGIAVVRLSALQEDPDAYRVIATTLHNTGVFGLQFDGSDAKPTAFRPPLYPWLLSWFVNESGELGVIPIAIFHTLLGVLTVVLTWDIARRLFGGMSAWFASGLVLIDPILLWQQTLVMTETIAAALSVFVFWWWIVFITQSTKPNDSCPSESHNWLTGAIGLGVGLGCAILCRPTFLVWAAMLVPSLFFVGSGCRFRRLAQTLVVGLIVVATVSAWTLRNLQTMGHPIWATTHGGYTLLLANNESFYDYLTDDQSWLPWERRAWNADEFFQSYNADHADGGLSTETDHDRKANAEAKALITSQPKMFAYSCWVRWTRLWHPFPHATNQRGIVSILAVGFFHSIVYVWIVIVLIRKWPVLSTMNLYPVLAMVITLSAIHSVYWSNPRMRSPAIPMLAVVASAGLVRTNQQTRSN